MRSVNEIQAEMHNLEALCEQRERLMELGLPADEMPDHHVAAFPSLKAFLTICNGKARRRIFDEADYKTFCEAYAAAMFKAKERKAFYNNDNAGAVANSYGNTTTTALWGVWTTPDGEVRYVLRRPLICGRSVPCAYFGGSRQYLADFYSGRVKVQV